MPQLSVAHHIPDPNCKPMSSSSYSNIMPQQRDITNEGINSILSDFQLTELHQTLDTLSNMPSAHGACSMPYPPSQQPPPLFEAPSVSSHARMQGSQSFTNGSNVRQNNSSKRLSVDMSGNVSAYPGDPWLGSRSSILSDDSSTNQNFPQISRTASGQDLCGVASNSVSIYPTSTKRQNVGRANSMQYTANSPNMTNLMLVNNNQRIPYQHLQFNQPMGLQPTDSHFFARPRLFDSTNFNQRFSPAAAQQPRVPTITPLLYPVTPRLPQSYQQVFFRQPQPKNVIYENVNQQNATGTSSSGGESVAQSEKRSRFMRTAQLLEQSGLMEVTMKTAALMKENVMLQRDIDFLMAETMQIEQNLMAIKAGNAVNSQFILQENFNTVMHNNGPVITQMSQPHPSTAPNPAVQPFPPFAPGTGQLQRHILY